MDRKFDEDFLEFIFQRRSAAYSEMLQDNTEQGERHAFYTKKHSEIQTEINKRLGTDDESFKLLFDLSDAANLAVGIEMDIAYIQGLRDGFNLVRVLNKGIVWPKSRNKDVQEETKSV